MQPDYTQHHVQQEINEEQFGIWLQMADPALFMIWQSLRETSINPIVVNKVIQHLDRIATSEQYGEVVVTIQGNEVTFIKSVDSSRVNQPVLLPTEEMAVE